MILRSAEESVREPSDLADVRAHYEPLALDALGGGGRRNRVPGPRPLGGGFHRPKPRIAT